MDVCTSVMLFLNSRIPFPIEPAISGMRFAPKSRRTMSRMTRISPKPRFPMPMVTPLEEGSRDQVRDQYAEQAQKRHVERDRPYRKLNDDQVDWQRAPARCHARRQKFLHRAGRQEPPCDLRHEAANNEADREDQRVKSGAVFGRALCHQCLRSMAYAMASCRAARTGVSGRPSSARSASRAYWPPRRRA